MQKMALVVIGLLLGNLVLGYHRSDTSVVMQGKYEYRFSYKSLIVPSSLILYGAVGTYVKPFKQWNVGIRDAVVANVTRSYHADDYLRYASYASVYLLDAIGLKAKHRFVDRSIIALSTYMLTSYSVGAIKGLTHILRPDSSLYTSFPSGHTAIAFAGAEFLWQEYKDQSIWIGIAGYSTATAVGVMRVINNKHWLTDVVAAAGFGMLCTKTVYVVHERVKYKMANHKVEAMIFPYFYKDHIGMSLSLRF